MSLDQPHCTPPKARIGPYEAGQCRVCWRQLNRGAPRGKVVTLPSTARRPPCRHRGEPLSGSEREARGLSHLRTWVLCQRPGFEREGEAVCGCTGCGVRCPGYEPEEPDPPPVAVGDTRHLLYYVLPVAANGVWQERLDSVKARITLFNGRRVVAVATGQAFRPLDLPAAVAEHLRGTGCEIVEVPHNPALREVAAWELLWSRLADFAGDPGSVAWFAHAKGVSKPVNPGVTVHEWYRLMVETTLDYWPLARSLLGRYPIVGSLKKVGAGFPRSRSRWHYSGTVYWVRVADFFARGGLARVDRTWWGTESTPGVLYAPDEGGVIFKEAPVPRLNLYLWRTLRPVLEEYHEWKSRHSSDRTDFGSLTGS